MPNTIKAAVLDDYQHNAESLVDWSNLAEVTTVFFHDHISDLNQLVARLEPFAVVVVIRERTRFGADLISRLPNLQMLVTIGMRNAAIDLEAANLEQLKERHSTYLIRNRCRPLTRFDSYRMSLPRRTWGT
jgi:phosphoglycerate dehydrogenase-like enzyme